jgi:hypothetical protein
MSVLAPPFAPMIFTDTPASGSFLSLVTLPLSLLVWAWAMDEMKPKHTNPVSLSSKFIPSFKQRNVAQINGVLLAG